MKRTAHRLKPAPAQRTIFMALALLVLLPPFGCYDEGYYFGPYPSLAFFNPIYTDESIIYDPDLEGKWGSGSDQLWEFSPGKGRNHYHLVITTLDDEDEQIDLLFITHLVSLGEIKYLDLQLDEKAFGYNQKYMELFLPWHWILRVEEIGKSLVLTSMKLINDRSAHHLTSQLETLDIGSLRGPGMTLGEVSDEDEFKAILVTAKTVDLQQFIIQHQDNEELELFDEVERLERVEPAP